MDDWPSARLRRNSRRRCSGSRTGSVDKHKWSGGHVTITPGPDHLPSSSSVGHFASSDFEKWVPDRARRYNDAIRLDGFGERRNEGTYLDLEIGSAIRRSRLEIAFRMFDIISTDDRSELTEPGAISSLNYPTSLYFSATRC